MDWVWELYRNYVLKQLALTGGAELSDEEQQRLFLQCLSESTVTVLVQTPWRGSVRFKKLARYEAAEALALFRDPQGYLGEHFGGGKFKLNFHRGWHFVATQNFKPEGAPRWMDLPEIE